MQPYGFIALLNHYTAVLLCFMTREVLRPVSKKKNHTTLQYEVILSHTKISRFPVLLGQALHLQQGYRAVFRSCFATASCFLYPPPLRRDQRLLVCHQTPLTRIPGLNAIDFGPEAPIQAPHHSNVIPLSGLVWSLTWTRLYCCC